MPGTTRYSATFDRPYEEDDRPVLEVTNGSSRRSRSASWQANVGMDSHRHYTPLGHNKPLPRSSSTDNGPTTKVEHIPTRTVSKTVVKTHNNPFQFVKVATCPLYRKAEDQIKKTKEVKKPEVLKEEEEEWQTNLDSWKSRRRKMSEDVFRRQEEIRQFEQEEQSKPPTDNRKIKTFSEMVESRAHRGRALSLCLISSPLETQEWETESKNSSQVFSEGSGENSVVNSEDEISNDKRIFQKNLWSECANENGLQCMKNGSNGECRAKGNEVSYTDSGLESISSSHRTGDTPDSCSDFSQDSGSSIDCDSARVSGMLLNSVSLLEDYSVKESSPKSDYHGTSHESNVSSPIPNCEKIAEEEPSCISPSAESDLEPKPHLSENGFERSIESENEVFVDDFEALPVESTAFPQHSPDTIRTDLLDNSEGFRTSESLTDLQNSSANLGAAKSSSHISTSKFKTKILTQTTDASESVVPAAQKLSENSTSGSGRDDTNLVSEEASDTKKENKKKRRRKKAIAEVESVEISNETTQPSTDTKAVVFEEKDLNIIFHSHPVDSVSSAKNDVSVPPATLYREKVALNDVLPVEKVAEEMEKLILQQLEEEERAKEFSHKVQMSNGVFGSPDHNMTTPSKILEPPKEKPPPPPCFEEECQKPTALKRVNSTKRIKKEIHKRRSNFLGIEGVDDSITSGECLVQPPPALEQILKAEMELDRESRKRLESEADLRLKLEECEIMEKEREIIASLESEEIQRTLMYNEELFDPLAEDRIQKLKEERKIIESDQTSADIQRLTLNEQQQLKEREEFLRKQEETIASVHSAAPVLSDAANLSLPAQSSNASPLCTESISGTCGELGSASSISLSQPVDSNSILSVTSKPKPAVPPKPFKKKEAIRKERERLRQEQEALQREREEHRQRLLREQEELSKSQPIPHAPILSRLGPVPFSPPSYSPQQLTYSVSSPLIARENIIYASHGFQAAQNAATNGNGYGDSVCSVPNKGNKQMPSPKKGSTSDQWGLQQASPSSSPKKPSQQDSDGKYNQNHWLIQEAEMRRITELDRPRPLLPRTHLAEDDVCSLNAPVTSKPWNRPSAGGDTKKFPSSSGKSRVPPKPPAKPNRVVATERPEHMLSVSGRKRCSHCSEELGRGAAMIIESLQLYYHIHCFQCCVCQAQLGNGLCGADVRVRNNKLHCHNCYSNDEAGLKFSQV